MRSLDGEYTVGYLWESKEAYDYALAVELAWQVLKKDIQYFNSRGFTLEKIEEIKSILLGDN